MDVEQGTLFLLVSELLDIGGHDMVGRKVVSQRLNVHL